MKNLPSLYKMMVCKHISTDTIIIIESIDKYKDSLLYNCLVITQDEKGQDYLANASYSPNEVKLLNKTVEEMVSELTTKKGIQLELF